MSPGTAAQVSGRRSATDGPAGCCASRRWPGPGARLGPGGRYRLDVPLGQGGYGTVWRGVDLQLGQVRAIKVLPAKRAPDVRRAIQKLGGLEQFAHERLARVYASFQDTGTGCFILVMEYVAGRSLRSLTQEVGPFEPAQAVQLSLELCEALAYLASRGVVHLDVRPRNIMLGPQRGAVLVDFDNARPVGWRTPRERVRALAQRLPMSLAIRVLDRCLPPPQLDGFRAPEVVQGAPRGPANDVFSLGGCLYTALTAEYPPPRSEPLSALRSVPQLLPELVELVERCRDPNPRARPSFGATRSLLEELRSSL